MKKVLFFLFGLLLINKPGVYAQRQCDFDANIASLKAHNPSFGSYINAFKATFQSRADNYKNQMKGTDKPTYSIAPVPVIFHIVIDSAQFVLLGSTAGIKQRCDSQIAVLNRDFNALNSDSNKIPSAWMPYFANVGIHFGLATIDPSGNVLQNPGVDIHIISDTGFVTGTTVGPYYDRFRNAKHADSGGVDAWDVTRYANVWCIRFINYPGLLGSTVPKSWTPNGGCDSTVGTCAGDNNEGICIYYEVLGKRASPLDYYPQNSDGFYFDEGRTLTHEMGHLFEIWHVWGDDGGLCPWSAGGGDDGIQDTPPQGNFTNGNPGYTLTSVHGTINDGCKDSTGGVNVQPIGIACLDYMDYTDDQGMHLFTPDQAAVMQSMIDRVGGENYDLVRYPELTTAIPEVLLPNNIELNISPNPTRGSFNIIFDATKYDLHQISILNVLGQEVNNYSINGQNRDIYSVNLSTMSKGIYFVHCTFATGTITRKILLQ